MLTDPKLRSQVDALWDKFWIGELFNLLSQQEEFASVVWRASCRVYRAIESRWGRMDESTWQVEGLFESLLAESFS